VVREIVNQVLLSVSEGDAVLLEKMLRAKSFEGKCLLWPMTFSQAFSASPQIG